MKPYKQFLAAALALGATAATQAQDSAEVLISVSYHDAAPSHLLLRPVGQGEQAQRVEWLAERSGQRTAVFSGKLAPGRYELLGIRASVRASPYLVPAVVDIAARPLDARIARFDVRAGAAVDLGRVWIDTLGGNLALLLRDPTEQGNAGLHSLPADATVERPWSAPLDPVAAGLLKRAQRRALVVSRPVELASGDWLTSTSRGEVLQRQGAGPWRVAARSAGQSLAAFDRLGAADFIIAGEFGQLSRNGAVIGQLPAGLPVHLHCTASLACVAVLAREDEWLLVHSADAAAGEWRSVAMLSRAASFWMGPAQVSFHRVGEETLIFPGKKALWRVTPAQGSVSKETLEKRVFGAVVSADRVTVNGRYSDDGGSTWTSLDTRMRDGFAQFDAQGVAWVNSIDIGMNTSKPILRRSPAGKMDWTTVAGLPVQGVLLVGRYSPVLFLSDPLDPGSLWQSTDQGQHWAPDSDLNSLLENR